MDNLTFIIEVLKQVTWPVAVILILLLFKKNIIELIKALRKIKYGKLEIEVEQIIENIDKQNIKIEEREEKAILIQEENTEIEKERIKLFNILKESPTATVLEGWRYIENELYRIGSKYAEERRNLPSWFLINLLKEKDIINSEITSMLQQLHIVRNEIAHPRSRIELGESQAIIYTQSVIKILGYLKKKK